MRTCPRCGNPVIEKAHRRVLDRPESGNEWFCALCGMRWTTNPELERLCAELRDGTE